MVRFVIFGAGLSGAGALNIIGYERVEAFIDNKKNGELYYDKPVISFNYFCASNHNNKVIVIASEKYHAEIEKQVKNYGGIKYFVYHDVDIWRLKNNTPSYLLYRQAETVSYSRILNENEINKYEKICILGDNEVLHYLILEVAYQNSFAALLGLIRTSGKGEYTFGINEVSLHEIWNDIDCLILNCRRFESKVFDYLDENEHSFDVISMYDVDNYEPSFKHYELEKYKDIYKGKRIWLVGNGPSMNIEDLETLSKNNEICFGFNKIFRIFNKTTWRPTFLCISDYRVMETCDEELNKYDGVLIISDEYHRTTNLHFKNAQYCHFNIEQSYPNYPQFSDDVTLQVFLGNTSVYDIGIQFATYMGASEIYLVGIDNNYSKVIMDAQNHFIEDNFKPEDIKFYKNAVFEPEKVNMAFEKAEIYSRKHGFRIYNATRGGKLEVFERVDFDRLFDK